MIKEDRISKLPDAILQTILSFVDVKQAIQTSILSKRWNKLWSSLPDLDFNFRRLALQSRVDLAWSHENDRFMPRFTHFVTELLCHRDDSSPVSKFQLTSSHMSAIDSSFVEKWVDYAINHSVQHLDLNAYCHPTPFKFPDGFFANKSLTVLKLKQYINSIIVPKPFSLPNLKTLYLEGFMFKDDVYSFSKEPFSSFPNLEELTLHRCEVDDLIISAGPKLRSLRISFQDPFFSRKKKMEQISASGLTSFRYEGYVSLVCPKVDLPCLEEVYYDVFAVLESPYTDDVKTKMPQNLVRMLKQLGNATFVTLTLHTIEVLAMDPQLLEQSPSPFPYLKCLKLAKRHFSVIPMKAIPRTVMNYLTKGSCYGDTLVVKFPQGHNEG